MEEELTTNKDDDKKNDICQEKYNIPSGILEQLHDMPQYIGEKYKSIDCIKERLHTQQCSYECLMQVLESVGDTMSNTVLHNVRTLYRMCKSKSAELSELLEIIVEGDEDIVRLLRIEFIGWDNLCSMSKEVEYVVDTVVEEKVREDLKNHVIFVKMGVDNHTAKKGILAKWLGKSDVDDDHAATR